MHQIAAIQFPSLEGDEGGRMFLAHLQKHAQITRLNGRAIPGGVASY